MSIKVYLLSIMNNERKGPLAAALGAVLFVLSKIYALAIRLVDLGYKFNFRTTYKSDLPVISVGNITLGGTGKTPFAIYVADYLIGKGKKTAVVLRGYGKDEYHLIKDTLSDVMVFVGQNRSASAALAEKEGCDVIVLDDAFQHRKLKRDLDIVLIDAANPFGCGELFPRGILREPLSSLTRADLFVITKVDSVPSKDLAILKDTINGIAPGKPIVEALYRASCFKDVTGASYESNVLTGKRALLVSAIGSPEYFEKMIKNVGVNVVDHVKFGDHHDYNHKDLDYIGKMYEKKNAERIIVTEKDYVKIKQLDFSFLENKLFILKINLEVTGAKEVLVAGLNRVGIC